MPPARYAQPISLAIAFTATLLLARAEDQRAANRLLLTTGEYHLLSGRQGAAAVGRDHYIYIVGGNARGAVADIERFDVLTHRIVRITDKLLPRRYHNVIEYQDRLYIFGGEGYGTPDYPYEEQVEIFDCVKGTVTRGAPLDEPGAHMAGARYGDKVYLCGGTRKKSNQFSQWPDTDIYDLKANTWTKGPAMPMPRESSGALVGDFIIIAGGYRARRADDSVDLFMPKENAWRSLPPLSRSVSAHATVFLGQYLFLFGDYGKLDSVLAYDLRQRKTLELATDFKGRRHSAAVVLQDTVYVIGGNATESADESDLIQSFRINPDYRP